MRARYQRVGRQFRSKILDEFCAVCGYHRKHAIRLLRQPPRPPRKRPGPKPLYDGAVAAVFKALWLATDQLCSKRLKAVLPLWLPYCVVFCPSMKLVSKKRVKARLVKKHDPPHTPYERLLATPQVSKDKKRQLRERFAQLNPFELKKNIERN